MPHNRSRVCPERGLGFPLGTRWEIRHGGRTKLRRSTAFKRFFLLFSLRRARKNARGSCLRRRGGCTGRSIRSSCRGGGSFTGRAHETHTASRPGAVWHLSRSAGIRRTASGRLRAGPGRRAVFLPGSAPGCAAAVRPLEKCPLREKLDAGCRLRRGVVALGEELKDIRGIQEIARIHVIADHTLTRRNPVAGIKARPRAGRPVIRPLRRGFP